MDSIGKIRITLPHKNDKVGSEISSTPRSIKDEKAQLAHAKQLIADQHYQRALSIIERLVSNHYWPAQLLLGDMYYHGFGPVTKNIQTAKDLYKQAATAGSTVAYSRLGTIYYRDRQLDENFQQTWHWCKEGAKLGLAEASSDEEIIREFASLHNKMGVMYAKGWGTEKDELQAMAHFKLAASHGDAAAQGNMGALYQLNYFEKGDDCKARAAQKNSVEKDNAKASVCYRGSIEHGGAGRLSAIKSIYQHGHNVEQGHAETLQWNKNKQALRFARECTATGDMYRLGNGVAVNYAEAKAWYQKAIEHNEPGAFIKLAKLTSYEQKQLLKADKCYEANNYEAAYAIWWPLANNGSARAQLWIGKMFQEGLGGVEQNYNDARIWYQKAAEAGDTWACNNLGLIYKRGLGVPINNKEAVTWLQKSIVKDEATAYLNLANMHQFGCGVKKDLETALNLYKKSAAIETKAENGFASYRIATAFKDEISASDRSLYLKKAHELGHLDAIKTIFALSEEYQKKYEDSTNEADREQNRLQADDLLKFAVEANYSDAVKKVETELQLRMERQLRMQVELEKQMQNKAIESDDQPTFNWDAALKVVKNFFSSADSSSNPIGKDDKEQLYEL